MPVKLIRPSHDPGTLERGLGVRHLTAAAATIFGALTSATVVAGPPCYYDVTVLDLIPDCAFGTEPSSTTPLAIADNGWITGRHPQCNGTGNSWVMLNTGGTAVEELIPPIAGVWMAEAYAITKNQLIAGQMSITGVGRRGFFLNQNTAQWVQLNPGPGGNNTEIRSVNESGVAVGSEGNDISGPIHAAFWQNGVLTSLGPYLRTNGSVAEDINKDGIICGWKYNNGTDIRGFIWDAGIVTEIGVLPDGLMSESEAINRHKQVVGRSRISTLQGNQFRSFIWEEGDMVDLGVLPDLIHTNARDINDREEIVGYCAPQTGGGNRAFYWRNGEITALDDLVDPALNLEFSIANSINNHGQIVAIGSDGSLPISFAVLLTPSNPGDVNGDCVTNVWDLVLLLTDWGGSDSLADFDGNRIVNVSDLLFLLRYWG